MPCPVKRFNFLTLKNDDDTSSQKVHRKKKGGFVDYSIILVLRLFLVTRILLQTMSGVNGRFWCFDLNDKFAFQNLVGLPAKVFTIFEVNWGINLYL